MLSGKAQVVDVLRSMQRDDIAIKALEQNIQRLAKSLGVRSYRTVSKYIPLLSSLWYYYVTSGNNLQTLGEEYSNIIRVTDTNSIPNTLTQLVWLTFYIGGEPLLNRFMSYVEVQIKASGELREEARESLLNLLDIWRICRGDLLMMHKALFYMNAKYYSFAHRIVGIKYMILRDWLIDKSFETSFKVLGSITLIYGLFNIFNKLRTRSFNTSETEEPLSITKNGIAAKICVLCNETRKNPSSTPCGHIFCWDCIQESLSYSNKCPLCREEVLPSRIIFLQNFL